MADMGLAVGGRRAVVERVCRTVLPDIHGFLKNVVLFPELTDLFFPVYKVQIRINFPVHVFSLSLITSNADCFAIFPINI